MERVHGQTCGTGRIIDIDGGDWGRRRERLRPQPGRQKPPSPAPPTFESAPRVHSVRIESAHRTACVRPHCQRAILVLVAGVLAVAGLVGCSEADRAAELGAVEGQVAEQSAAPAAESMLAEPLDATNIEPRFTALGPGRAVDRFALVFARPVVAQNAVGTPFDARAVDDDPLVLVEIEPDLPGSGRFTDPSTFVYELDRPPRPETEYVVRLQQVRAVSGTLAAPDPEAWAFRFATARPAFERVSLEEVDETRRRARVALRFAAAVDPAQVARSVGFEVFDEQGRSRGRPRSAVESRDPTSTVTFRLSGDPVVGGRELAVRIGADLQPAGRGETIERLALPGQETLRVLSAYLAEGPSGFRVEVVCDDSAAEGRRWYWAEEISRSWQTSSRCLLDERSTQMVTVEPALPIQLAGSGGGFQVRGDFDRGRYRLRIEAGARGEDGGALQKTYDFDFTVPARSPQIAFAEQGRYLRRDGWRAVPLRHLNLARAELEVRHVPVENLAFWLGSGSESTDESNSRLIAKGVLPLEGDLDEMVTTSLDLSRWVPNDGLGLYEVRVRAANEVARTRLLLTDLTLVAKRTGMKTQSNRAERDWGSGVDVWALDQSSLAGRSGVTMRLLRRSGQPLATCTTGRDGGCSLRLEQDVDPAPPFVLVAQDRNDVSYIAFDELRAPVQEARVAGLSYRAEEDAAAYAAALYTERGVYRPGDRAHLAALVRDRDGGPVDAGLPVELGFYDPRGKLFRERTLQTNGAGFVTADLDFADFATTGRYEAVLEIADREVARERFQVEEFVPERLEVNVNPAADAALAGEPVTAMVDARFLFGGTPRGAPAELDCELQPTRFRPVENAQFSYDIWTDDEESRRPLQLGSVSAALDAEGVASMSCPAGAGRMRGAALAILRAAVSEAGSGRATVGRAQVPVHPERFYLGLQAPEGELSSGDVLAVEGAVVDWSGELAPEAVSQVQLEFVRLEREWGAFYDEDQGRTVYRSYRRPVVESEREVPVQGARFSADLTVGSDASGYLVRVRQGNAVTELVREGSGRFYGWSPWETSRDLTPRPGPARWIALDVPDSLRLGESFDVTFDAPFAGRALFTLESDEVLRREWRKVEPGSNRWSVNLRARDVRDAHDSGYVPNVYAGVLLLKDPHLESPGTFLPDRAHGVASVAIVPEDIERDPVLDLPDEVRSNAPLRVALDLGAAARGEGTRYVTVAAVDEGILSLTDFASPDPIGELFPARGLGVETYETVGWTLAQLDDPASATGGDQVGGMPNRVAPVRPVALWSGLREVPADGKLDVVFQVPEYRGALRVMAVAAGRTTAGSAEGTVLVRDPLVLQATLPRFLVDGDEVQVPTYVTNLAGSRQDVEITIEVESVSHAGAGSGSASVPVRVVGDNTRRLALDVEQGGAATFRLRSTAASGVAQVRVRARSDGFESSETLAIPLVPVGPRVRRSDLRTVEAGVATTLDLEGRLDGWVPMSENTTFWLTPNRFADVFQHFDYLVRYPYGCLEQTTSSTRPLLSLRSFAPLLQERRQDQAEERGGNDPAAGADFDELVQSGVERILSMQTPQGGFAYWPGGDDPAYWASAYATDFLLDAKAARFEVPEARLNQVLDWMERETARTSERLRDGYRDDGTAYMLYVLAKADRGQQGRVRAALDRWEEDRRRLEADIASDSRRQSRRAWRRGESDENRLLLEAALFLSGDQRFEQKLREPVLDSLPESRSYGWSFYSARRHRALALAVAADLFGRDGLGGPGEPLDALAQLVAEGLRGQSRRYTTQELVWGLVGLSRYSASDGPAAQSAGSPPELWIDGRRWDPVAADGAADEQAPLSWTWDVPRASERDDIELRLPAREGRLFLQTTSLGVRSGSDQPQPGASGIALRRLFRRADGTLFDPASESVALGEVVLVALELQNLTGEQITNLAVVDRVAAGFDIENPRFARTGDATLGDWVERDAIWELDHLEVRDDRVELFGSIQPSQKRLFIYQVRATSIGATTAPMPTAEAMYNPEVWARASQTAVTVSADG